MATSIGDAVASTRTDQTLAALEESCTDPERADVIRRTRRFKASWIELAEALVRVRRERRYEAWGFESFDEYAKSELRLRKDTADKLTLSFSFLRKRAPEVLSRASSEDEQTEIPSYQAIDFLRRAEEQSTADHETMDLLRQRVLEEGAPLTKVAREFKNVFPIDKAEERARSAASLKGAAMRLRELLGNTEAVSKKLAKEVSAALERLIEELAAKGEKAA